LRPSLSDFPRFAPVTKAAGKQKDYRQRQAKGVVVLRVPVHEYQLLDALIAAGRLSDAEALDRSAVERQLSLLVDEWLAAWKFPVTGNASREI